MRIAFFVNKFPSKSQTFITSQIIYFIENGHIVDIFSRSSGENILDHTVDGVGRLNRFIYYGHFYSSTKSEFLNHNSNLPMSILLAASKNIGPLLKLLIITRLGSRITSFNRFKEILILLRGGKLDYDIVHCHFGPNGNIAAILKEIGILSGKIVTTFHGYDMTKYIKSKGEKAYELLFDKGDLFLPISDKWKSNLIKLGCSKDKVMVHRMGVDLSKTKAVERKRTDKRINLLSVARLAEKKGLCYGIEAVAKALKKHPNIKYMIAGDGPLRPTLQKLINDLGVAEQIELLGWKNHEEVFTLLSDTDIFIAPSVTDKNGDQEGIPVTLMEAMAHAIPVLSTLHSGIPELVEDGVHGFLVPERDIEALTEKLDFLVNSPEIRLKMGKAGRDFVVEHYDNKKLNERLREMFENIQD